MNEKKCTFCDTEEETLRHLYWNCCHVQAFWRNVQEWLCDNCDNCNAPIFSELLILLGLDENFRTDGVVDLLVLLGKYYIYQCRLRETLPSFLVFKTVVKNRYLIERYRMYVDGKSHKFRLDWLPYELLITDT